MAHLLRIVRRVVGVAMVLVVTACGSTSGTGSKTGGDAEPVVLTLADGYGNPEYVPSVSSFVQRVEQLSGGRVRIRREQAWGHFEPGFEQKIVSDVAAGKADLGWTGTRVFDTLGVTSFQALTAPMLIDSYPLEDAVIAGSLPREMLGGLDPLHVTGLAVLGGGLRKPIAKDRPLLSSADWKGVTFNALRSTTAFAAIKAAGGVASDDGIGTARPYSAAERSLLVYQDNYVGDFRYVTANVNLWPETVALFANPAALTRLTGQQQAWVRTAAQDAVARSTALSDRDQDLVNAVCAKGARLADASAADQQSLRSVFEAVYTSLGKDPTTRSYLARIAAIKQGLPVPPALEVPIGCRADRSAPPAVDPLEGVWTTRDLSEADIVHAFVAAGGSEADAHEWFSTNLGDGATTSVSIRLRFAHGTVDEYERADGGSYVHGDGRTYLVEGRDITFSGGGCEARYTMQLKGDTLRLRPVQECPGHDQPYGMTVYGGFAFQRTT